MTSEVNKWPAAKPHRSMGHVWPGKIGSLEAVRGQRSMATKVFEVKKFKFEVRSDLRGLWQPQRPPQSKKKQEYVYKRQYKSLLHR